MSIFSEEFKSRNFSIYGQWAGVLCIVLCFALGIANLFSSVIAFSIVCLASSIFLIFIEVPFLLRICPTSSKFDDIVRRFTTNYMRALIYVLLSVVQWLSLIMHASSLIAAAVFLDIAAIFYALAGMKAQDFQGSKILGGAGIAQMIV
ncbi:Membrane protein, Golgi apparatus TVP18/Calcium channel flower [Ascosphaera apis ARSEF 7405]|uniref:Membrane protein, Golgi apparatus TVP18/Calcium channel flower n=1 Tax=Ascosphaera apis ARSEF 7405 TaxID=392613 RepID=A0A168BSX3_9EURO|nr:Membrane protein, Golgi apparatus TVP18/Calcium channel flower [Ascosphaera apis ARSEF 7405]